MKTLTWILIGAMAVLWIYYAAEIEPASRTRLRPLAATADWLSPAGLNNGAITLHRRGRHSDALALLESAARFAPQDPVIQRNLETQVRWVRLSTWRKVLGWITFPALLLLGGGGLWRLFRRFKDRRRLRRVSLRGQPYLHVDRKDASADLALRFSGPIHNLLRRHPLTLVWSSPRHGKHMKSRPPATLDKQDKKGLKVALNKERLEKLRRHPGEWNVFLYLGERPVGKAHARVA